MKHSVYSIFESFTNIPRFGAISILLNQKYLIKMNFIRKKLKKFMQKYILPSPLLNASHPPSYLKSNKYFKERVPTCKKCHLIFFRH